MKKVFNFFKSHWSNPFKWNWKFKILALIIVAGVGVGIWQIAKKQSNDQTVKIQTLSVQKSDIFQALDLSGQIEQSNLISVLTKASGVVSKVYVTDGQQVKAGDKLAEITLDSEGITSQSSAWASYLSAKNSLDSSKTKKLSLESSMWAAHETFESKALDTELSVDDPIYIQTNRDWLAAEQTYLSQQQAVAQSQASVSNAWYNYQLYQATVTAPVDGKIVGMNLAEGLTISYSEGSSGNASSQTVAKIQTQGTPIALFNVSEVDIGQIKVGQQVTLTLDSLEDLTYIGTVVAVDRVGSVTSNVTQYPVLIKFDSQENLDKILTNMAVNAQIVLDSRKDVVVIPLSAVTTLRDKKFVKVQVNGNEEIRAVETGLENDTQVEITNGLSEGDIVILQNGSTSATSTKTPNNNEQRPSSLIPVGGGMGGGQVRGLMTNHRD